MYNMSNICDYKRLPIAGRIAESRPWNNKRTRNGVSLQGCHTRQQQTRQQSRHKLEKQNIDGEGEGEGEP